jgi:hypothetical protein
MAIAPIQTVKEAFGKETTLHLNYRNEDIE